MKRERQRYASLFLFMNRKVGDVMKTVIRMMLSVMKKVLRGVLSVLTLLNL